MKLVWLPSMLVTDLTQYIDDKIKIFITDLGVFCHRHDRVTKITVTPQKTEHSPVYDKPEEPNE